MTSVLLDITIPVSWHDVGVFFLGAAALFFLAMLAAIWSTDR